MDLVLKNLVIAGGDGEIPADVGIADGTIVAVEPGLTGNAETLDMGGRLAVPGFVESHVHLDKACILERCRSEEGTLAEAIREVSAAKRAFTAEDIHVRAARALDKCILQGTNRIRTHLEVDPVIGLTGLEAILSLVGDYAWAVDLEICVFPQEGLLNNPGTDELMTEALRRGASVVGGCPYADSDPLGQIDRIFEMALAFDVDIDFHLDFDTDPVGMTVEDVCRRTERHRYGGRVTIGHVSKLSALPVGRLREVASRLAGTGVAVTALPSTDLYLMGAGMDHDIVRGVAPVHRLIEMGVNCALSTNNVLNPFTPFGDCSMVRMANLYANIGQIGSQTGIRQCLEMVTDRPARLMRLDDYGIVPGNPADIVILDCRSATEAVQELAIPLHGFKRGRRTFTRKPAVLHRLEEGRGGNSSAN
ncbi:MAG TPA: amidohydrolase family protein [Polyangia bacterium]|nr:amidohydrolase family protein [Armatimonadota bacterium]HUT78706.1 amidohydrolase family protein [Polyangia bacterium]